MDRRNAAPVQGCSQVEPVNACANDLRGHEDLDIPSAEVGTTFEARQLVQRAVHRFDRYIRQSTLQVLDKFFNVDRLINEDHSWPIVRIAEDLLQFKTERLPWQPLLSLPAGQSSTGAP